MNCIQRFKESLVTFLEINMPPTINEVYFYLGSSIYGVHTMKFHLTIEQGWWIWHELNVSWHLCIPVYQEGENTVNYSITLNFHF